MEGHEPLHRALKELMAAIAAGEGGQIAAAVKRLDALRQELGSQAPPMLRHYLEKRSYAKALDFLEGRDEAVVRNC